MNTPVHQSRCSFLELLILAILINEGDLHGYALYKRILDMTRMHWRPSIGTVYRFLNDMAERKLILKNIEGRRYSYSITPQGLEYFIRNSKTLLTRKIGALTTVIKAYFKIAKGRPNIVTANLREKLRALRDTLDEHKQFI